MSGSLPPAHCLNMYQISVVILCWKIVPKTIPWLRQLVFGISPRIPGFDQRPLYVGFVVDNLALGQGFHRVLLFSAVALTPRILYSDISFICYGRWDTRWRSWFRQSRKVASLIPHDVIAIFHWHNPSGRTLALGVDTVSNRNEYQYWIWGKDGRWLWLITLPPSCADCLEVWEPQPPGILRACPGLYRND